MFDFQDLFQWDRFITPTIIKTFYWLVIALILLFGIAGIFCITIDKAVIEIEARAEGVFVSWDKLAYQLPSTRLQCSLANVSQ